MITMQITNVEQFLHTLLHTTRFDKFLLEEAMISSLATYKIDGHINSGALSDGDTKSLGLNDCDCLPFSYLREKCISLMHDLREGGSFHFTFKLSPDNLAKTVSAINPRFSADEVTGLYMNFRLKRGLLICTSGVSHRIFSIDKTIDRAWDNMTRKFLLKCDFDLIE